MKSFFLEITFAYVVPPVILLLAKSPVVSKYDLSSVRMMNSGAAPLTKDLVDAVHKRLQIPVKQGYGLSETSPTTHTQPWEDWNTTIGSVGRLLPNMTAKYIGDDEKEVPAGQTVSTSKTQSSSRIIFIGQSRKWSELLFYL